MITKSTHKLGFFLLCALMSCVLLAVCALTLPFARSTSHVAADLPASAPALSFISGNRFGRTSSNDSDSAKQRARTAFASRPMNFEANQGQFDAPVKYMARSHGYTLYLTSQEALFALPTGPQSSPLLAVRKGMGSSEMSKLLSASEAQASSNKVALLRMQMRGANPRPLIVAEDQQPGKTNYIIGNDPKNWHSNIPQYARVHYRDVYPGVDVIYRGAQQLEFDFLVNPGADPSRIDLGFRGAQRVSTDGSGNLVLTTKAGQMRLMQPFAYQEKDGVRQTVQTRFVINSKSDVALALSPYDHNRQLVIDPSISYATYFGGPQEETGTGVALDAKGNVYLVGAENSNFLPGSSTSVLGGGGAFDGYVSQITPTGKVNFTTLFGGTDGDYPQAVAVDATGGIYIAGVTRSLNFPVTPGAAQTTYGGSGNAGAGDAFVVKLKSDGSAIMWATYCGGNDLDAAFALAVDSSQNVYIAGETFSQTKFPVKNPLTQGGTNNGGADGFVTEIKSDGSAFLMSSYMGGAALDFASGVAWNPINGGTVYVTGGTESSNLPVYPNPGAYQVHCGTDGTCNGGLDDAFVAAFNPANTATYTYFTYLGGEATDVGLALTTDSAGNAYVTGKTQSINFLPVSQPITPYQSALAGTQNAFVTVLNPTGTGPVYSTYLGGNGMDKGLGIALDGSNNVYVTGQTTSTNFPLANPTQQAFGGGNVPDFNSDAFLSELSSNGTSLSLPLSTYIGGSGDEDMLNGFIVVDNAVNVGNIYVVGDTNSLNFPIQVSPTGQIIDPVLNGGQGLQSNCQIINQQTQQVLIVSCPDAWVNLFTPNTSGLLVSLAGTGTGTVTSSPSGITCPGVGTCSASFSTGTTVTLAATATNGSVFGGWGGTNSPCSGSGACAPTLNSNQFVTATFTPPAVPQLTVSLAGSGKGTVTSSPNGINCPSTCGAGFNGGTKVTLTATPAAGSTFAGWSGGVCSGSNTCTVTLNVNEPVTATFNLLPAFSVSGTALSPSSVSPGGSATSTITVASIGSFNSSVSFACNITPAVTPAPTCSASAVTPAANGKATTTLTVSTTGPMGSLPSPSFHHSELLYALILPIGGVMFFGIGLDSASSRKKLLGLLLVCLVLSGLIFSVACGSSSHTTTGSTGTPANTYTIQLTGASGSMQVKANSLTLTVQ